MRNIYVHAICVLVFWTIGLSANPLNRSTAVQDHQIYGAANNILFWHPGNGGLNSSPDSLGLPLRFGHRLNLFSKLAIQNFSAGRHICKKLNHKGEARVNPECCYWVGPVVNIRTVSNDLRGYCSWNDHADHGHLMRMNSKGINAPEDPLCNVGIYGSLQSLERFSHQFSPLRRDPRESELINDQLRACKGVSCEIGSVPLRSIRGFRPHLASGKKESLGVKLNNFARIGAGLIWSQCKTIGRYYHSLWGELNHNNRSPKRDGTAKGQNACRKEFHEITKNSFAVSFSIDGLRMEVLNLLSMEQLAYVSQDGVCWEPSK